MKRNRRNGIVLFLALAAMITGFLIVNRVTYPPARPETVDSAAEWAGGRDGGSWVKCEDVPDRKNAFRCSLFSEDGKRLKAASFQLRKAEFHRPGPPEKDSVSYHHVPEAITSEELKRIGFSSWDGVRINLIDTNMVLIPDNLPGDGWRSPE